MVDVSDKPVTARRATAEALVAVSPETMSLVIDGGGPKGDVLGVAEIAYRHGYSSLGPFNRAFKGIVGQTPTEYRKAAQQEILADSETGKASSKRG
jgi:AraC-like DNA-binding protein